MGEPLVGDELGEHGSAFGWYGGGRAAVGAITAGMYVIGPSDMTPAAVVAQTVYLLAVLVGLVVDARRCSGASGRG